MRYGLARAVRRGLDQVAIQVFLTAVVMNLKRLAAAFFEDIMPLIPIMNSPSPASADVTNITAVPLSTTNAFIIFVRLPFTTT